MLTVRLFLVILVTLLSREICWCGEIAIGPFQAWLNIIAVCIAFGAAAKVLCIHVLRKSGAFDDQWQAYWMRGTNERWSIVRQSLESFWVLCLPATLLLTNWGPWIKQLDELGMLQSVSLVLWFVPSLAVLVILELTTSQMEVFVQNRKTTASDQLQFVMTPNYQGVERRRHLIQVLDTASIQNTAHLQNNLMHPAPSDRLVKILSTRIRLGGTSNVMACLLPVLLIAAAGDGLRLLRVDLPESIQSLIASFIGLGAVALFMPQCLSRWMGVKKLTPGPLRDRINAHCRTVGVTAAPMWVPSDGRWAGAAVVGWLPGFRQLWLGDALVQQLSHEEVDMVVMHELAHVKRKHFLWRLIPVLAASAVGITTVSLFSATSSYAPDDSYLQLIGQTSGMLLASAVMLFGIGYWSRLCELDADRTACKLAIDACPWAEGNPATAAAALARSLEKLHTDAAHKDRATWLHPGLAQRTRNLTHCHAADNVTDFASTLSTAQVPAVRSQHSSSGDCEVNRPTT